MMYQIESVEGFKEALHDELKRKGMTRNQLGNAMGGNRTSAYRMENPTLKNVLAACEAVGMTLCITDTPHLYARLQP